MMDFSQYDFLANTHIYKYKDLNIVVDVNSGAIHLLDELAYDLIQNIVQAKGDFFLAVQETTQAYPLEDTNEALKELIAVAENKALFSEVDNIDLNLSELPLKALCLNVAHVCNMDCTYCFAGQGDFGGESSLMTWEVGKKSIDFLLERSQEVRNLEIDFFGGEPLLNFELVKKLVVYAREQEKDWNKKFNFTLTTNAVLLDTDIMNFIIENDIAVVLSLDGRAESNDRHRLMKNGEKSYEKVLPRIQELVDRKPISHYIRGTFTRDNMDFSEDLKHLVDLGFDTLSLEPAIGADNTWSIKDKDLPKIINEYEKLSEVLLNYYDNGQDIHFFHFQLDLQKGPCIAKRMSGCGAALEYIVVTPDGDIYPCHQFVGEKSFYLGNVLTLIDLDSQIRNTFAKNHLEKTACKQCWARYYCGGGCHANAYFTNFDIEKPSSLSCEMHKKRIECAIYIDLYKRRAEQGEQ